MSTGQNSGPVVDANATNKDIVVEMERDNEQREIRTILSEQTSY